MQRYFGETRKENIIVLNPKDYNHIKNVMRFKTGDKIEVVFDEEVYLCTLMPSLKECEILESIEYEDSSYIVRMFVPILPEEKMDLILQKCTELGVREFIPVNMERCKFKIDKSKEDKKISRWTSICKEASEQSLRNYIPKVHNIISFNEIDQEADKLIVCSLDYKNSKTIKETFKTKNNFDIINVVFGPEGGLSNNEENILLEKGYDKVCFGRQVLRTETTPIFISGVIRYLYMEV